VVIMPAPGAVLMVIMPAPGAVLMVIVPAGPVRDVIVALVPVTRVAVHHPQHRQPAGPDEPDDERRREQAEPDVEQVV